MVQRRARRPATWQRTSGPGSTAAALSSLATHAVWLLPTENSEIKPVRQKKKIALLNKGKKQR